MATSYPLLGCSPTQLAAAIHNEPLPGVNAIKADLNNGLYPSLPNLTRHVYFLFSLSEFFYISIVFVYENVELFFIIFFSGYGLVQLQYLLRSLIRLGDYPVAVELIIMGKGLFKASYGYLVGYTGNSSGPFVNEKPGNVGQMTLFTLLQAKLP